MKLADRFDFAVRELHQTKIPCGFYDDNGGYYVLELAGSVLYISTAEKTWMFEGDVEQKIAQAMEVFGWH